MSALACTCWLALTAQLPSIDPEVQREFEATLATDEGFDHVKRYARQNNQFINSELEELAAAATQSQVEDVPRRALYILKEFGAAAGDQDDVVYPFLDHVDPMFRLAGVECLGAMHPGRFYPEIARMAVFDDDFFVYQYAVQALAALESADAVPWILTGYLDEDPQRAAAFIRGTVLCAPELQAALIPGLIQILRRQESAHESQSIDHSISKPLREDAIDVLGGMGELAADYLPEIERMQDREEDPVLQLRYAVAITSIGGLADKQVERMRAGLEDKEVHVCIRACRACIDSPLLAEAVRDSLVGLAEHENAIIRENVSQVFLWTNLSGPDVIAALEVLAVDYSDELFGGTCWNALEALAHRGELEDPLARVLAASAAMEDDLMFGATRVLRAFGEQESLRLIEAEFASADPGFRDHLGWLLESMPRESTPDVYRRLLELPLTDEEREWLTSDLAEVVERNTPSPRLTDWRLPTSAEPAGAEVP